MAKAKYTGKTRECKLCHEVQEYPKAFNENQRRCIRCAKKLRPPTPHAVKDRQNWGRTKKAFGISKEDYFKKFEAQGGTCAICHKPEVTRHKSGNLRRLAIDHDHVTGQIRGLLCSKHNLGLGCFGDSADLLRVGASYLDSYKNVK